jgi:hypothetical protein
MRKEAEVKSGRMNEERSIKGEAQTRKEMNLLNEWSSQYYGHKTR